MELILASASPPQGADGDGGLRFFVIPSDADEDIGSCPPGENG